MGKQAIAFFCAACAASALAVRADGPLRPTPEHMRYQEREILGLVCWGPNTYTDQEWGFGNVPASRVNPDALDPEQWVIAMKAAEIKSVVLVAKHHDGFCLWPSKTCPDGYSTATAAGTARGRDIVGELAAACRKHGLKFGVYISPWDRHQASYGTPAYVDYFFAQWREVLTNYGEICEVWLDGANGGTGWYGGANGGKGERRSIPKDYYRLSDLRRMMHELQPTAIAFGGDGEWSSVWCGNESGHSPETWKYARKGEDGKPHWMPSECDTPFRCGWYYHASERPKSLARLVKTYYESVGRAAVLNFGISPDRHGLVCEEDVKRLREFGDWVRAFNATDCAADAVRTDSASGGSLTVTLKLPKPVGFNAFDLKEDLRDGQRAEKFVFEAKENGVWTRKFAGTTVGYRRFAHVGEVETDEVRVTLSGAVRPALASFALRRGAEVRTEEEIADGTLPRAKWRPLGASCGKLESVKLAFDGNPRSLWHTHLSSGPAGKMPPPQGFAIDCGEAAEIGGFVYTPRRDGCPSGTIDAYKFLTSDDGKAWTLRASGEFGNIAANPVRQRVALGSPVTARYVKFVGTHAIDGNGCCAVAEFHLLSSAACAAPASVAGYAPEQWNLEARQRFAGHRFGIFIVWGLYANYAQGEWYLHHGRLDRDAYERMVHGFYPSKYDAREWARVFRRAGAKYVTITARHHDGFALWPSKVDDYNIAATPFKRDVIGELAAALKAEGIELSLYYSLLDWHRPDYVPGSAYLSAPAYRSQRGDHSSYRRYMMGQIAELLENYRPISIWFDGEWDHLGRDVGGTFDWGFDEIYDLIHAHHALVLNNHHRAPRPKEDIQAFERDLPGSGTLFSKGQPVLADRPIEQCDVIQRDVWGYRIGEKSFRTGADCVALIVRAAARNSNLLLNIGPDGSGQIPAKAVEVFEEIGRWMDANGDSVYGTVAGGVRDGERVVSTRKGDTLFIHFLDPKATEFAFRLGDENLRVRCPPRPADDDFDRVVRIPLGGRTPAPLR